jgi:hypothetical protein
MRLPSKFLLAAITASGVGLLCAAPAVAASYRCSAGASVNDAGPSSDSTTATPCALDYQATGGQPDTLVKASTSARAGVLNSATSVATTDSVFAGASSYSFAGENLMVSGLGADGADLAFLVAVDGTLSSDASNGAAASSSFAAATYLSTSRGLGATSRLSGCTRNVASSISTCNGVFDYGVSLHEDVDALMPISIHVWNGDILQVGLELRTSSLGYTPGDFVAFSGADFGHTLYWGGLQFTDASRHVVLTGDSGFDYRYSAFPATGGVPEPASWALMILGFGAAGSALRRRRALAV